jgi:hypothetical protein
LNHRCNENLFYLTYQDNLISQSRKQNKKVEKQNRDKLFFFFLSNQDQFVFPCFFWVGNKSFDKSRKFSRLFLCFVFWYFLYFSWDFFFYFSENLFETFLEKKLVTFSLEWSNVTRKNYKLLKNGNWKNPIILFQVFLKRHFRTKQNQINSSINQIESFIMFKKNFYFGKLFDSLNIYFGGKF